MRGPGPKLSLAATYRGIARTCREQWRLLLVVGVVVFIPVGFAEALDERAGAVEVEHVGDLLSASVIAIALAHAATALVGDAFYSGVVAAGVAETRGRDRHSLAAIARSLPYGRLVAVDVLFSLLVLAGFVLLIVPGLLFYVWFALAGPVVKIEKRRALEAMRRSRELVRGSFWRVFAVLIPLELVTSLIIDAAGALGTATLGHSLFGEWIGSALGGVLATPLYAAAVVVLAYELIELERES